MLLCAFFRKERVCILYALAVFSICKPHNSNYVVRSTEREYTNGMKKTIKRIWNSVTTVLVALVVLLAVLIWGFRLFDMEAFVVQSGSMEPAYHVGSLVYVKEVDASELEVGDVITFNLGGNVRGTHRIIEVVEENGALAFRTKGDANETADNGLVSPADIIGEVKFTIPYLGFLITYIQSPPGMYVAVTVVAVILLLIILPDILFGEKKKEKKREDAQ